MIARLQRRGQQLIVAGLVIQGIALLLIKSTAHPSPLGFAAAMVAVAGLGVLMVGMGLFARAKGQHPAYALLALLSIFGLTILLSLPDLNFDDEE
jgi:hypothetical protein